MHIYEKIYQFAASAGAFEGYVYQKKSAESLGMEALAKWADNLVSAYRHLPLDALAEFQDDCDQTLGRAVRSLTAALGEDHDVVQKVKTLIKGNMPESADDFNKRKWFQE